MSWHRLMLETQCLIYASTFSGCGENSASFPGTPILGVRIGRRLFFRYDVGPFRRVFSVKLQPEFRRLRFSVGKDRFRRAFRHADTAVDALLRVDNEHVLAFVEAVHGTYLHAVRVLAFDAVLGDHKRHFNFALLKTSPGELILVGRLDGSAGYRQRHLRRHAGK